ncbi:hypothetical protein SYNPS1DRAFT_30729 [Syncephalis pseudoplumigaleata]|uniref:Uncharacterized protein n=1 Tax=Syncephalis pseudoplumigaleata TaxID=1712513 RepID=A0A4P9YX47_9FUNG|nr:hypothetical protein SYNPS1DRAFT_30729 [Syncephalis pseudoplumigaleata]|eukprot:RKP23520.1 hypothetical protein SYNPS1DRAFT_30729 [Syncephalis pseudoplumigaleata]
MAADTRCDHGAAAMGAWLFGSMERQWDVQLSPQYQAALDGSTPPRTASQNASPDIAGGGGRQHAPAADPRRSEQVDDELVEDLVFIDVMHDVMRTVIGALLFPAIASFCGSMLGRIHFIRSNVRDPFNRSVLGGCLFVVAKDMIRLLYKRQRLRQRRSRRVRDISEMEEQSAVKP